MNRTRCLAVLSLLAGLLALAACQMDLLDVVKREVEEFRAGQAGSPGIAVLKGIEEVQEGAVVAIGPALSGEPKLVTFSIENPGRGSLQLTGSPRIQIGGPHAAQYAVNTLPASVIAAGGKSDFIIAFTPSGSGTRTATILIEHNAPGDGEFEFTIVGEGVGTAGPEIQVTTGATVIDDVPGYTHGFGKLLSGEAAGAAFTIYNIGTPSSWLWLMNHPDSVQILGPDADMFSVVEQPAFQWLVEGDPVQSHTTFALRYQPTDVGTHTATVRIVNDDADEGIYTFELAGSCYRLDVLFLVDTSGSMGSMQGVFDSVRVGITDTMSTIAAEDGNARFALAAFNDFPYGSWGTPATEAYELLEALTADQATVSALLMALTPYYGFYDNPGSHLEALYQGTTGEGLSVVNPFTYTIPAAPVGWRTHTLRVIVLISDSPFHNPDTVAGYPGHNFYETAQAMNDAEVRVIAVGVGSNSGGAHMQQIAALTGGVYVAPGYYSSAAVMGALDALIGDF